MKRTSIGDLLWVFLLLMITGFLLFSQTRQVFILWTNTYPYCMGFIKFAFLATMGELLALRLSNRLWKLPTGLIYKAIVWGIIGMLITFMFSFYAAGISTMIELGKIPHWNGFSFTIFKAFLTSMIMNLTFGIVLMAMHRISDTYIEMRVNHNKPSLKDLIRIINWKAFISFIVCKTIPLFWIPAHTITFVLPPYHRVVVAAYLSIVLGTILVYSNRIISSSKGAIPL
jgi:hypothetical protein